MSLQTAANGLTTVYKSPGVSVTSGGMTLATGSLQVTGGGLKVSNGDILVSKGAVSVVSNSMADSLYVGATSGSFSGNAIYGRIAAGGGGNALTLLEGSSNILFNVREFVSPCPCHAITVCVCCAFTQVKTSDGLVTVGQAGGLSISTGGVTIQAGDLTVPSGGVTVSGGNVYLNEGALSIVAGAAGVDILDVAPSHASFDGVVITGTTPSGNPNLLLLTEGANTLFKVQGDGTVVHGGAGGLQVTAGGATVTGLTVLGGGSSIAGDVQLTAGVLSVTSGSAQLGVDVAATSASFTGNLIGGRFVAGQTGNMMALFEGGNLLYRVRCGC